MIVNGHTQEWIQAAWFTELVRRALRETPNAQLAMRCAEQALAIQPFPDEDQIDRPDDQSESWREEDEEIGTGDGKPVDAAFSFDIFNPKAQGILNKAIASSKNISAQARKDLEKILSRRTIQEIAHGVEDWGIKYRNQLAKLLSTTQLASLLAGMRQVAMSVPIATLPLAGGADAPLPASLLPEEAVSVFDRLKALTHEQQEEELYKLPPDQQSYFRVALQTHEAQPPAPPPIVPEKPPAGTPERIHWPVIDEASRLLSEKNLVSRLEFDRLDDAVRQKSFTVAGVANSETLGKIRDAISQQLQKGVDVKEFKDAVLREVEQGTFLSDAHMETVFRTNVQTAFTDGTNEILEHPFIKSGFPYAAYESIHDDRVRPDHRSLESYGIGGSNIYRRDDPTFERFQPPWDYNCRCSWIPLSVRMAAEQGVKEAIDWIRTGRAPQNPTFVDPPPFEPEPSFRTSVSAVPLSIQLSMTPLSDWENDEHRRSKRAVSAPLVGPPLPSEVERSGIMSTAGDFADKRKPSDVAREKRLARHRRSSKRRRLGKGLRLPKAWRDIRLAWAPYQGQQGGRGWKNTATGEIRYQIEKPQDDAQSNQGSESRSVSPPKDEAELHQRASDVADSVVKKTGGIAKLGAAGKWLWQKTTDKYKKLEARYGKKTTLAIVGASIVTFPVPFNITAIIGLAELYRKLAKPRDAQMSWSPFQGPQGGQGWKNTATGEVRYQVEKPSDAEGGQPQTAQKQSATPLVLNAIKHTQALYEKANELSYDQINQGVEAIAKMSAPELMQVAKGFGINRRMASKGEALGEIERKIKERKGSFERIQFRDIAPEDVPPTTEQPATFPQSPEPAAPALPPARELPPIAAPQQKAAIVPAGPPITKVADAVSHVNNIYENFQSLSYEQINSELIRLQSMPSGDLKQVVKAFGIHRPMTSKKEMLAEIERKIKERKGSFERIQFRDV